MKFLTSLFILFLYSLIGMANVLADDSLYSERETLLENKIDNNISPEEIYEFPEIHLYKDRLLKDLDNRSGVFSDTYNSQKDKGRLGFSYAHSVDIDDLIKIQSLEMTYMSAFANSWQNFWWGLQYKFTAADLEAVSEIGASSKNDDLQTYSFFGYGVGHRFQTLGIFFNTDRMFEMVSVYFNIVLHNDNLEDQNYTGFGYNADYSFSLRSSKNFFWGGKISYNWALVEKPQEDQEALAARSRVFGWTSIGFEFGYIF